MTHGLARIAEGRSLKNLCFWRYCINNLTSSCFVCRTAYGPRCARKLPPNPPHLWTRCFSFVSISTASASSGTLIWCWMICSSKRFISLTLRCGKRSCGALLNFDRSGSAGIGCSPRHNSVFRRQPCRPKLKPTACSSP